jgi:hypothetical protein
MGKPRDDRQKGLLLPALDQIIDMGHPLVRLAALIPVEKRCRASSNRSSRSDMGTSDVEHEDHLDARHVASESGLTRG